MAQYILALASVVCSSSLTPYQSDQLDATAECSLLQVTLVSRLSADIHAGSARIGTEEGDAGARPPRSFTDATPVHAKLATEDVLIGVAAVDRSFKGAAVPARKRGQLALFKESLSFKGLGCFAFVVVSIFFIRRKRFNDARSRRAAQTIATSIAVPSGMHVPTAPGESRRAFNLMTGAWEDVAEMRSPLKVSRGRSGLRAKSNTRDQRGRVKEVQRAPRAKSLDSPGEARSIVILVMTQDLVVSHAPCGALRALREVREVLAAAESEQPLRLEKSDLLTRGITPRCFELLRAAGLRDVGRGLVLDDASEQQLAKALAAVNEALRASPRTLPPLPAVQVVTDAYGSYAEEEIFTYN